MYLGHGHNRDEDLEAIRSSSFRKMVQFSEGERRMWTRGQIMTSIRMGNEMDLPQTQQVTEEDIYQITECVFALGKRPTMAQAKSTRTLGMERILLYLLRDAECLEKENQNLARTGGDNTTPRGASGIAPEEPRPAVGGAPDEVQSLTRAAGNNPMGPGLAVTHTSDCL